MGASNSKNEKLEDLYFEEITVSKISTQYQTESKNMEIKDDFVQNLSQESNSNKTENFSTFIPSISQNPMKKRDEDAAEGHHERLKSMLQLNQDEFDEFSSDEIESDDSYDWDSDDFKRDVLRLETLLVRSTSARNLNSYQQPNPQDDKSSLEYRKRLGLIPQSKGRFLIDSINRGFTLHKCQHPGGTNPTLGVRNFEMSSELSEMNYEVTTVNTSAIQS